MSSGRLAGGFKVSDSRSKRTGCNGQNEEEREDSKIRRSAIIGGNGGDAYG
jgi:hypothetical protein